MTKQELSLLKEVMKDVKIQEKLNLELDKQVREIHTKFQKGIANMSLLL